MAPHSSTLAWKIPWMQEPGRLQSMGLLRVRHDWATSLSLFTLVHCRRKWQPTPVFLHAESQGWGEPDGLLSLGLHRVRHDWSNLAAAVAACRESCHLQTVRVLLLLFQFGFLLLLFILWLLWLKLPKLCWIVVVRVGTLVLFLTLGEMLSIFHHWR